MDNTFILSFINDARNEACRRMLGQSKPNMLKGYMISVEQAINIYHLLNQVVLMKVPGDIVELGCYEGTTAIILQKTLAQMNSERLLHVYDSFEGLPEALECDGPTFKQGALKTSQERLLQNFKDHNTKPPIIHPGFFADTLPSQLPEKIAFAHLDGDFYSSIKESLENIYPRLSPNAVVLIDDYCDPSIHNVNNILPGVKKACDEFFQDKPEKMAVLIAGCESHGYFRKL